VSDVLLSARGLRVGYGGDDVLHDVDLALEAGRSTAVIGPNGSGKSTLVRALAGTLPDRGGTIELLGRPLGSWRRREVASLVAVVPQLVEFTFPLTVREVVEQGRSPHLGPWNPPSARDHAAVGAALARTGLSAHAEVSVRALSGGQRQLVLLARALAVEPRVLLMDEPAAALDVRHQLELVGTVRGLLEAGVAVMLVVHDWNLALRAADAAVVLRDGSVTAAGPLPELFRPDVFLAAFGVSVDRLNDSEGRPIIVPRP
jgi:ABC-type cobalamin/Fe3+-siderophores transport system ATPase subunit